MFEKVKELIVEGLGVDASQVTLEATFDDLGADSLDLFELVMSIEEEFGVDIPTDNLEELKTVQDVVNYIAKKNEAE
jgi:acyl carrier protein